jgi:hypothetical protein
VSVPPDLLAALTAAGLDPQAAAALSPWQLGVRSLPASTAYPIAVRIGADGSLYADAFTVLDTDTRQAWRLTVASGVIVLRPVPTVADIRADFATVQAARDATGTVAGLRRWGF